MSRLLSMPMRVGITPVIMAKREGTHTGLAQNARSKRAPVAARPSIAGVFSHRLPAQPSMEAFCWSVRISTMFGLPAFPAGWAEAGMADARANTQIITKPRRLMACLPSGGDWGEAGGPRPAGLGPPLSMALSPHGEKRRRPSCVRRRWLSRPRLASSPAFAWGIDAWWSIC